MHNGATARFWYDNWNPFGCLHDYLHASNSRFGIPLNATVASSYWNGAWRLPPARSEQQLQQLSFLTTVQLVDEKDCYLWEIEGKKMMRYETGKVYHYLRGNIDTVQWALAVWSSKGISRLSFHSWLVVLDRNPTRDHLISWGVPVNHLCLLCNSTSESRDTYISSAIIISILIPLSLRRCCKYGFLNLLLIVFDHNSDYYVPSSSFPSSLSLSIFLRGLLSSPFYLGFKFSSLL